MKLTIEILLTIGLLVGNIFFFQNEKRFPIAKGAHCYHEEKHFLNVAYDIFMIVGLLVLLIWEHFIYPDNSVITIVQRVLLLTILFASAYWDFRYHLIPNLALLEGYIGFVVLAIISLILNGSKAFPDLVSALISAGFLMIICFLLRVIVKNGIGMGDIKLLMLMGLLQGMYGVLNSLILSLILIFFYSLALLILRKKGRKDEVAFAPAILLGTYISIMMTGV